MPTGKKTIGDIYPASSEEKSRVSEEARSFKRAGVNPKTMGETEASEKLKMYAGKNSQRFDPGKNLGKYLHKSKTK